MRKYEKVQRRRHHRENKITWHMYYTLPSRCLHGPLLLSVAAADSRCLRTSAAPPSPPPHAQRPHEGCVMVDDASFPSGGDRAHETGLSPNRPPMQGCPYRVLLFPVRGRGFFTEYYFVQARFREAAPPGRFNVLAAQGWIL
eukprot:gene25449-biopygen4502